ncbi:MAG: hypothetical protein JXB13_04070 [Phycisphaerae bacterium]|nr:hypothetical protein [Phycisphaerae bacterium]
MPPPTPTGTGRIWPWASLVLAAAAVGAGVVTVFVGRFDYRCTIEYGIDARQCDPDTLAAYRHELILHLTQAAKNNGNGSAPVLRWTPAARPDSCSIRYDFVAPSVREGNLKLVQLSHSYPDHLRSVAELALSTPTGDEQKLMGQLDVLRARLSALTGTGAPTSQPVTLASNPLLETDSATASLQAERVGYDGLRGRLDDLVGQLTHLQQTPVPRTLPVDPEMRHAAMEADVSLQQDLKTMEVHLAETRARLLEVYHGSLPALRTLSAEADAVQQLGETKTAQTATGEHRLAAERLVEAANDYQRLITRFAGGWRREFIALQDAAGRTADPAIIETQDRLARLLSDLLFETVEPLSTLKDQVDAMAADPNNAARHHELITLATRRFNTLRAAHHQFEFSASDIRALNNPRLDAALRTARALHRRTQERIRTIDQTLQAEAYRLAVEDRDRQIAELQEQIDRLRPQLDQTVTAMLSAQDVLTQAVPRLESFLHQRFHAQRHAEEIRRLETEIADKQSQLNALAPGRTATVDSAAVTVLDRRVDRQPVNLLQRLASGWLVTATALVLILLGQGLIHARQTR